MGIIGSGAIVSHPTKATSARKPAPMPTRTRGDVQPSSGACTTDSPEVPRVRASLPALAPSRVKLLLTVTDSG